MLSRPLWFTAATRELRRWHPAVHRIEGLPWRMRDPARPLLPRKPTWRSRVLRLVTSTPTGFARAKDIVDALREPGSKTPGPFNAVRRLLESGELIKRGDRIHARSCDARVAGWPSPDPGVVVGSAAPANFEGDA